MRCKICGKLLTYLDKHKIIYVCNECKLKEDLKMNYKFNYEKRIKLNINPWKAYLNKNILDILDNPKFVSLGLDKKNKALCVTLPVPESKTYKVENGIVSFSRMYKHIIELMNLKPKKNYYIPLIEVKNDYFLIFDLTKIRENKL